MRLTSRPSALFRFRCAASHERKYEVDGGRHACSFGPGALTHGIPGARAGMLTLRIRRHDRNQAKAIAEAIVRLRVEAAHTEDGSSP